MVTKRGNEYRPGDFIIGAVNLLTDIFYNFWKDLLTEENQGEDISKDIEQQLEKERALKKNLALNVERENAWTN